MNSSGLADGLGAFLAGEWGEPVEVAGLTASTTGARRANLSFDARGPDGRLRRLVATIVPTAVQINPVAAEVSVRSLALAHGVPVPAVVAWSDDPSWVGGPFFVSEFVDGETVPRRVLRLIEADGLGEQVARQLGLAVARLHSVPPSRTPADLPDTGQRSPASTALAALADAAAGLLEPRPALTYGLRWLEDRLPPPPPAACLVHTDLRTGNLIVGDGGLRAVLDWEGARFGGDPMEDVAWLATRMWRFGNDALEIGGFSRLEPFVAAYEAAGGWFDAARYRWWRVFSALKWALGLAAQAAAHIDGTFPSIVMAASGRRVPEMEWDLLMLTDPRR